MLKEGLSGGFEEAESTLFTEVFKSKVTEERNGHNLSDLMVIEFTRGIGIRERCCKCFLVVEFDGGGGSDKGNSGGKFHC